MSTALVTMAAALSLLGQTAAPRTVGPAASQDGVLRLRNCVVSLIDQANVPSKVDGVLLEIVVREGQMVKKDDLLAQLDDRDAKIRVEFSQFDHQTSVRESESRVNIEAATATKKVAEAEHDEAVEINAKAPGSVPNAELRRLLLTAERAGLQIEVAELEHEIAGLTERAKSKQVEAAAAELDKRRILSPIDGVVVQRFRNSGEWVSPGDPVVYVVRMDRLRVEGFLNASDYLPQDVQGRPVIIQVPLARGLTATFRGKIDFVNPLIEATGEYRVWADVENRVEGGYWLLRPGVTVDMYIQVDPAATARSTVGN